MKLIEKEFPVEYISAKSSHERYLRKGHFNSIKTWWARRPIIGMRGIIYASLIEYIENNQELIEEYNKTLKKICEDINPDIIRINTARKDILSNNEGRSPKLLDCFSGGGAIPLEASRLGLDTHSVDLHPSSILVQIASLLAPQRYNKIYEDVMRWGVFVINKSKNEVEALFPTFNIPDDGYADTPIVLFWGKEVKCPNCTNYVSLSKLNYLAKRKKKKIAIKREPLDNAFYTYKLEKDLISDIKFWKNSLKCDFCNETLSKDYLKKEGSYSNIKDFIQCLAFKNRTGKGKLYVLPSEIDISLFPNEDYLDNKLVELKKVIEYDEYKLKEWSGVVNPTIYGYNTAEKLFNNRQLIVVLTIIKNIKIAFNQMINSGYSKDKASYVVAILTSLVDHLSDWNNAFTMWISQNEQTGRSLAGPGLGMKWDYIEINPFSDGPSNLNAKLRRIVFTLENLQDLSGNITLSKGSAMDLPYPEKYFDLVVTDPPYFDSLFYTVLADCLLPWQKIIMQDTSLKLDFTINEDQELVASRHRSGNLKKATRKYKGMMLEVFNEISRTLKDKGLFILIYSQKTLQGWSVIADVIKESSFSLVKSWAINMERMARPRAMKSDALASVLVLVMINNEYKGQLILDDKFQNTIYYEYKKLFDNSYNNNVSGTNLLINAIGSSLKYYTNNKIIMDDDLNHINFENYYKYNESILKIILNTSDEITLIKYLISSDFDSDTKIYIYWRYKYGLKKTNIEEFKLLCTELNLSDVYNNTIDNKNNIYDYNKNYIKAKSYDERNYNFLKDTKPDQIKLINIIHYFLYQTIILNNIINFKFPKKYLKYKKKIYEILYILSGTSITSLEKRSLSKEETAIRILLSRLE